MSDRPEPVKESSEEEAREISRRIEAGIFMGDPGLVQLWPCEVHPTTLAVVLPLIEAGRAKDEQIAMLREACQLALNAFERNDCIDWDVLTRALARTHPEEPKP